VSSSQHAELVDKINQLNILRESNATLRSDSEANRKRAERFQSQLLRLKTEHEPIKLELVTVKAELEERQRQNEQFQSDIEQLKERFASVSRHTQLDLVFLPKLLLLKHDRVDPDQLAEVIAAKEAAEAKCEERFNVAKSWKERYDNLVQKSREELTKRNTKISQLEAQNTQAAETSQTTTTELEQLRNELAKVETEGGSNDSRTKALEEAKATLEASVVELTAKVAALEAGAATVVPMSIEPTAEQQTQLVSNSAAVLANVY
jgi:nucleoprotein TPR